MPWEDDAVPGAEDDLDTAAEGGAIINASWAGTAIYVALAIAGTIAPDWFAVPTGVMSVALFFVGCIVFLWAYAKAVSRSRRDLIGIGGLYFLVGTAPNDVAFRLRLSLALEIVAAIISASIRPFTPMAFGFLVPVYGLGLSGLWGARYGAFEPRTVPGQPGG
jgi:hypothetical protein